MPEKSYVWDYFKTDGGFYKTDKSHENAFCDGCLQAAGLEIKLADTTVTEIGLSQSHSARLKQGEPFPRAITSWLGKKRNNAYPAMSNHVQPICGKTQKMESHLLDCKSVSAQVKTTVKAKRA